MEEFLLGFFFFFHDLLKYLGRWKWKFTTLKQSASKLSLPWSLRVSESIRENCSNRGIQSTSVEIILKTSSFHPDTEVLESFTSTGPFMWMLLLQLDGSCIFSLNLFPHIRFSNWNGVCESKGARAPSGLSSARIRKWMLMPKQEKKKNVTNAHVLE